MSTSGKARDNGTNNVQSISVAASFDTVGIGTASTVKVGTLPAGAQITGALVRVTTAFNAATTNVLTVGTSTGSNADIVSASDVSEGATGTIMDLRGCDLTFTSDTIIYVKYTQTGTAATTGAAVIVITFVSVNNG